MKIGVNASLLLSYYIYIFVPITLFIVYVAQQMKRRYVHSYSKSNIVLIYSFFFSSGNVYDGMASAIQESDCIIVLSSLSYEVNMEKKKGVTYENVSL